jgi:hypothetical protein
VPPPTQETTNRQAAVPAANQLAARVTSSPHRIDDCFHIARYDRCRDPRRVDRHQEHRSGRPRGALDDAITTTSTAAASTVDVR